MNCTYISLKPAKRRKLADSSMQIYDSNDRSSQACIMYYVMLWESVFCGHAGKPVALQAIPLVKTTDTQPLYNHSREVGKMWQLNRDWRPVDHDVVDGNNWDREISLSSMASWPADRPPESMIWLMRNTSILGEVGAILLINRLLGNQLVKEKVGTLGSNSNIYAWIIHIMRLLYITLFCYYIFVVIVLVQNTSIKTICRCRDVFE